MPPGDLSSAFLAQGEDGSPGARKAEEVRPAALAGTGQIGAALVKVFFGSAPCFLPRGFANGGWLFSLLALLGSCVLCSHCMFQLVDVRERRGVGSYGALAARTHPALG